MFSGRGKRKLMVATYAAFIWAILGSTIAQVEVDDYNTTQDCASSCGNIPYIDYPFRLETDPIHCGHKDYELACVADDDNNLTLYLKVREEGRRKLGYRVEAINYYNLTIRLVDPYVFMDNCTLRLITSLDTYNHSIYSREISQFIFEDDHGYTSQDLVLTSCSFPQPGKLEGMNSSCNKIGVNDTSRYWYVHVGAMNCSDMENSCRIEYKSWTSLVPEGAKIISYKDVNDILAYGFELSWHSACYTLGAFRKYYCTATFQRLLALGVLISRVAIFALLGLLFAVYVIYKGLLCCCGTPCVVIFLIYKWRRRHLSAYDNIEEFLRCNQNNLMPIRYSYSQIKKITKGFKEKLGQGGYGSVYKGKLRSGSFAAIKMLDKSKTDGQDFINEVATIGRIHHTNVVQLIGFCVEGSKRALVYEFMANGSLDKYIFSKPGYMSLNNEKIYAICLGVSHGIKYLHQGCDMQILHFDIKPHNILLDENFMPKISDFGLAKLHTTDNSIVSLTAARGTIGYMAPELFYKNIGGISYKADVYSFGMLLLEMMGKRKNLNAFTEHSSRIYFPSWIYDQISEEKDVKLGDGPEEENKIVRKIIIIGLWCIQLNPVDRPSMHKVIEMLEMDVEDIQMPPKPFVSPQEVHSNDAGLISVDTSCNYSDTTSVRIEED